MLVATSEDMKGIEDVESDIMSLINDKQEVTYNELKDYAGSMEIDGDTLKRALAELVKATAIASRSSGGIPTYYMLQEPQHIKRVFVVEDEQNINKLMAVSLGKGYDITQLYDGREALEKIKLQKPDLVILDLMLPHKDGLDICQTVKSDPDINNTVVILVSAMDPTSNRFKGIKYGADYYIKKPFDPNEMRSLVTLFLQKKGKRFDPLVDLPDEERISKEVERSINAGEQYVIGTLKIGNLATYAKTLGERSAIVLLRLVSQLLQDSVKNITKNVTIGFLNSDEFLIAGFKESVETVVKEVKAEFGAVLPFILQDAGYRQINLDIDALFESKEVPKLSLIYTEYEKEKLLERRNEILKNKGAQKDGIGSYTYEELQRMFGNDSLDIKITRDTSGVRIRVGKVREDEQQDA